MKKFIIEIYRTFKTDFGQGNDWGFIDKFVFRWYKNYLDPNKYNNKAMMDKPKKF